MTTAVTTADKDRPEL